MRACEVEIKIPVVAFQYFFAGLTLLKTDEEGFTRANRSCCYDFRIQSMFVNSLLNAIKDRAIINNAIVFSHYRQRTNTLAFWNVITMAIVSYDSLICHFNGFAINADVNVAFDDREENRGKSLFVDCFHYISQPVPFAGNCAEYFVIGLFDFVCHNILGSTFLFLGFGFISRLI